MVTVHVPWCLIRTAHIEGSMQAGYGHWGMVCLRQASDMHLVCCMAFDPQDQRPACFMVAEP